MAGSMDNLIQRKRNEKYKYQISKNKKQKEYDDNLDRISRLYRAK